MTRQGLCLRTVELWTREDARTCGLEHLHTGTGSGAVRAEFVGLHVM